MAPPAGLHIETYGEDDLAETDGAEHWQALWGTSPQRSPLTSLAYARAIGAAFPVAWTLHAVVDAEGRWQAGCITYERRRGPFTQAVMPPYTPYAPLVCTSLPKEAYINQQRDPIQAVLTHLASTYDHLSLQLHPSLTDVRPALWRGWTASPLYTHQLQLASEDDLLRRWSGGTRRLYQKHRDQYHVEEDDAGAEALIQLSHQSFARHDRSLPLGAETVRALLLRLQSAGLLRFFVARRSDGIAEAAVGLLHDGTTAHYWIAGSLPGPAMTVLLGMMLPDLHQEGMTMIDFTGANTPPIAEFKRHFGGTLVPFYHLEAVPNRWLHLYYSLRQVMGKG